MSHPRKIKLLVADDHQLVIDGICSLLKGEKDLEVVATAGNGKRVLELLDVLSVEVVLMDMSMPEMDGYAAMLEMGKKFPAVKVIILSMYGERSMVSRMMDGGAFGYLMKNVSKEELVQAIRTVAAGQKYLNADHTLAMMNGATEAASGPRHVLSERESEILQLIVEGYSSSEIGKKLFISARTVETHRANMMQKLGVNNVAGLIREALRAGLA